MPSSGSVHQYLKPNRYFKNTVFHGCKMVVILYFCKVIVSYPVGFRYIGVHYPLMVYKL